MIKLIIDAMLISVFWFIALYTFNMERIEGLILKKPKLIFDKKIVLFSKLIILIWMFIEALLMVGGSLNIFITLRQIMSMPFISHGLYIIHVFVLFTFTRHLSSKTLESEKYLVKAEKRAVTFANGLLVLGISIVIFYFQSFFWGEMKYIYTNLGEINLLLEAILDGVLILAPGIMILVNAIRFLKVERMRILALRTSIPVILLMSFGQTIMTKVIVFFDFFNLLHRLFLKQFGIKVKVDNDDKLLIGSSMTYGSVVAKINVYFLTAYFSTIMILWTLQISPLPIPSSVYADGLKVAFLFSIAIISFWVLETCARSFAKFSRVFRAIFIPLLIILTVIPFYTEFADANYFTRATEVISIYHKMALSLGSNKLLFFLCIFIMQASIAYILHIITGEAHNDRHYYSILPIIGIVQLMVLSILYPVFLMIPPYVLNTYKNIICLSLFIFALVLTAIIGLISHRFFSSEKSEWSHYVHEYWKDRVRVMLIVGIITSFSFVPIGAIIIEPIHNINLTFGWEVDYILEDDHYFVNSIIQTNNNDNAYIIIGDDKGNSKLISIATSDGKVLWEKEYKNQYVDYKVWENGQAVFTKVKNSGFSIIDLKNGFVQYDYSAVKKDNQFLNIEINDRSVLFTSESEQFIYDMEHGVMQLDTLGNNYYQLLPGDQCALTKNNSVYLFNNERWEKMSGSYNIEGAELLYYDKNGLIIFGKDKIEKYNYNLAEKSDITFNKVFQHIMTNNKDYYTKMDDEVAFYLYSQDEVFAYLFNTSTFTYKVIPLEQRLKDFKDYQKLKVCDKGSYFLYDTDQFTLYKNQNIIARQWYQLPLNSNNSVGDDNKHVIVGQPIKINDKIIWIEKNGLAHCIISVVQ